MEKKPPKPKTAAKISTAAKQFTLAVLEIEELVGNDRYLLNHVINLLLKRKQLEDLQQLKKFYRLQNPSHTLSLQQFYWWLKENHFSAEDIYVYTVFCQKAKDLAGVQGILPTVFCGRGSQVLEWIINWLGNAGNDPLDVLDLYFDVCIKKCSEFAPGLVRTPKSLLEGFGQSAFEEYIQKQGGKILFLEPSKEQLKESKRVHDKLVEIARLRIKYLHAGDLEMYDMIGKALTELGPDEVYKELELDGVN